MANVSPIDCERRAGRWVRYRPGDGGERRTGRIGCLTFESGVHVEPLKISTAALFDQKI